jgi:hypothetical protein
VKCVLELLNLIRIADDIEFFLLVRVQHTVSLDNFPHTLLVLSESGILGWDLRFILNNQLFNIVL